MRSSAREVENVPELIHHIQSRLPVKEAARTSVLSKSWLYAWSTIPTLRFCHRPTLLQLQGKHMKLVDIDRTLMRYIRDNIPIESFELVIDIENQESASLAQNWLRLLATKTCVKDLSLAILLHGANFNLPIQILSSQYLTKLSVISTVGIHSSCLMTTSTTQQQQHNPPPCHVPPLRQLHLDGVHISQEVLDAILSSCTLLAKMKLLRCSQYLNTIKVKNLPSLCELVIYTDDKDDSTDLEISHLPNIRVFSCDLHFSRPDLARAQSIISLGSSVTWLSLGGGCLLIRDNTSLDMIKSGFPLLERLTLGMTSWMLGSFHFRCASIKRLSLLSCPHSLNDVEIHAPKLVCFRFDGNTLPSRLLFPISTLNRFILRLNINMHVVDTSFFLKMREALTISRKCCLHIIATVSEPSLDINIIDNLRARLLFPPARNVQQLSFQTSGDECLWERSLFFDAFFEICHPKHIFAIPDDTFSYNNHFCRLMLREVLDKKKTKTKTGTTVTVYWSRYLKHVQTRELPKENWKTLTNSHRSFLDGSTHDVHMHFNLKWKEVKFSELIRFKQYS